MTKNISSRDWETLSAYLDGELAKKEQVRLETRLRDDPELNEALKQLRRTRIILRSQPKLRAPRNFTLTPEMVGMRPVPRSYPFLRFASAMAALLFVLVLVGDFLTAPGRVLPASPAAEQPSIMAQSQEAYPAPQQEAPFQSAPSAKGGGAPTEGSARIMGETEAPAEGQEPTAPAMLMAAPTPATELPPAAALAPNPAQPYPEPTAQADMFATQEAAPSGLGAAIYPTPYPQAASQAAPRQPFYYEIDRATWRVVEIILGILAVGSGLAAVFLRRSRPR